MSDNTNPKTEEASDNTPAGGAINETWLVKNTGPILAIGTVILTFFMFGYFVCLTSKPNRESVELFSSEKALADAETKFAQVSSSTTERMVPGKLDELRNERDKLKTKVSYATEAAEDAK